MDGNPPKWYKIDMSHYSSGPQPFKSYDDQWKSKDAKIVVLIAALRETRLPDTLHTMLTTAAHPERVFFAVVQQNSDADPDCVSKMCEKFGTPIGKDANGSPVNDGNCKYFDHVRVTRMKASEAKGPVYARAKQADLVKEDDQFCMQIDAHTHTVQDWDTKLLEQWGMTKNEYAVLTSYPTNVHDIGKNSNNHWEMPHLCTASFVGTGKVSNGQASAAANLERPILTPLWAAGLSFSRCHAERNVPNDPHLIGIFSGEEYGRGARLFTHGYDFYTITRPIVGTFYGAEKGNKGNWHNTRKEVDDSSSRLATLLQWPNSDQSAAALAKLGTYALGKRRTLSTYAKYSGVDTIKHQLKKKCRCEYSPWEDKMRDSAYSEYKGVGASAGTGTDAGGSEGTTASAAKTSNPFAAALAAGRKLTEKENDHTLFGIKQGAVNKLKEKFYSIAKQAEKNAAVGAAQFHGGTNLQAGSQLAHLKQLAMETLEKNKHTHHMVSIAEKAAGVAEEEMETLAKEAIQEGKVVEEVAEREIKAVGKAAGVELGGSAVKIILGLGFVVVILLCAAVYISNAPKRKRRHPKYSM